MKLSTLKTAFSVQSLLALSLAAHAAPVTEKDQEAQLQAVQARMDSLSEYAGSTTRGKDDVPVSMSGSIFMRLKDMDYFKASPMLQTDQARTWIDGSLDLALGVYPNSFVNLWTTMALPFDMAGWYSNSKATSANYTGNPFNLPERQLYHHSVDLYGPGIWESMTAGIDVRASDFGAMFKAGGVLWVNSSPLTIWEREALPRFPSVYETFEDERTVSTYYKEKMFRPVKEGGRAFWTNRSFGGIELEMYRLPFGMTGQVMLAQPKDADIGTRDGIRLLAGQPGDAEMTGDLDFRGDLFNARIAKEKIGSGFTIGANYVQHTFDNGLIYESEFLSRARSNSATNDVPVILNSKVASVDVKGNVNAKLFVAADFAMSIDDSVKFDKDTNSVTPYNTSSILEKTSNPSFAGYVKIQDKHWLPLTAELIFVEKDFYSPYSMTNNSRNPQWRKDEMYNGAGSFRYTQNLTGINFKCEPEFNRGRIDFMYGVHRQVEAGQDLISFNYRLNGRYLWESLTSWSKFASILPIDSGAVNTSKYRSRVGLNRGTTKLDIQTGDLRGGTWETWEIFGAYSSADSAATGGIPSSTKWSTVISSDMAYDIGNFIGYDRNVMLHLNTALTGVAKSFAPIPHETVSDMMLWSWFAQSEPTIAITPTFHMLGVFGLELFRAEQAYTTSKVVQFGSTTGNIEYVYAPINILETAVGFGFDWDFTNRAGVHVRYRYATHKDETLPDNNWKAHFVTVETKVWF